MLGGGRAMKVRDVASAQGGHSPVQPWTPRQTLASDHCNHCLCVCWGGAGMGGVEPYASLKQQEAGPRVLRGQRGCCHPGKLG